MKKLLISMTLLFAFNTVHAAGDKDSTGYYDNLLKGLKSKVEKKFESKTRVKAVAAVRGAKQGSDAEALYWKGGVSEEARKKLAEEKKALTDAVQIVVDGRLPEGKAALEKFIKDYPESFYVPDARDALTNLPAEAAKPAAAGKAEEKPRTEAAGPEEKKTGAEGTKPSEEKKPADAKPAGTPDAPKAD
jgi:hypothetical protein